MTKHLKLPYYFRDSIFANEFIDLEEYLLSMFPYESGVFFIHKSNEVVNFIENHSNIITVIDRIKYTAYLKNLLAISKINKLGRLKVNTTEIFREDRGKAKRPWFAASAQKGVNPFDQRFRTYIGFKEENISYEKEKDYKKKGIEFIYEGWEYQEMPYISLMLCTDSFIGSLSLMKDIGNINPVCLFDVSQYGRNYLLFREYNGSYLFLLGKNYETY